MAEHITVIDYSAVLEVVYNVLEMRLKSNPDYLNNGLKPKDHNSRSFGNTDSLQAKWREIWHRVIYALILRTAQPLIYDDVCYNDTIFDLLAQTEDCGGYDEFLETQLTAAILMKTTHVFVNVDPNRLAQKWMSKCKITRLDKPGLVVAFEIELKE
jgi:hypothetical protein